MEWGPGSLVHLHHSSKIKSPKEVIIQTLNCRNEGFSYYFGLAMEGSGAGSVHLWDPDPGGPRYTDSDPQHWFEVRQCMDLQNFFLPFKKKTFMKEFRRKHVLRKPCSYNKISIYSRV